MTGLAGWPGSRPLITEPYAAALDLADTTGQRVSTFTFTLINGATGENLGTVTPIRPGAAIVHNTTRTIKREFQCLLGAADQAAINPVTDRIVPVMTVGGVDYPLGRFQFTDDGKVVTTAGDIGSPKLVDEMFVVDQQLDAPFSTNGEAVAIAAQRLVSGLPIQGVIIEASPYEAVGAWAPGAYRGAEVLAALALQGDFESPWMDNDSYLRLIRTVDADTAVPRFDFDTFPVVARNSPVVGSNLLTAPNRWVVASNSADAGGTPIVGVYDVPAAAPWSAANRGFVIPQTINMQLSSQAQAEAVARNLATRKAVVEQVELLTAPDPRHDSYDVIRWRGVNWVEVAWTLPCDPGGQMSHVLRRNYR